MIIGIGAACPPVLYVLRSTSAGASDRRAVRRARPADAGDASLHSGGWIARFDEARLYIEISRDTLRFLSIWYECRNEIGEVAAVNSYWQDQSGVGLSRRRWLDEYQILVV